MGFDSVILETPLDRQALREAVVLTGGWGDRSGPAVELMGRLLDTITDESFPGAVIPRHDGKGFTYYLAADSDEQWRSLSPIAVAFVGYTLSTFDGRPSDKRPDDAFEDLLWSSGVRLFARVEAGTDDQRERERVAMSLLRMQKLMSSAPSRGEAHFRTTSSILADFRMALAGRNRESARDCIEALRDDLRLDGLNQVFMQIEADAAVGDWDQLWSRPTYREACRAYRPPLVTQALVRAAYFSQLEARLTSGAEEAIDHFKAHVTPRTDGLFKSSPPNDLPEVGLTYLLAAAAGGDPPPDEIRRIIAAADGWQSQDRSRAASIVPLLPAVFEIGPTESIRETTEQALLRGIASGSVDVSRPEMLRQAILAAAVLGTSSAAQIVVDAARTRSADSLEAALYPAFVREAWRQIRTTGGFEEPPGSWTEWLRRLPGMGAGEIVRWAETASAERPVEAEFRSDDDIAAFIRELEGAATGAEDAVRAGLPTLVGWTTSGATWPNPSLRPLYRSLLLVLLLGEVKTPAYVAASARLLGAILELGVDEGEYAQLLSDVALWVPTAPGTHGIDALLDLIDLTVAQPCGHEGVRLSLWLRVLDAIRPLVSRLTTIQREFVRSLAQALQDDVAAEVLSSVDTPGADGPTLDAAGLTVGIYTLTESAARRLKDVLEATYPRLRVEINSDHVATPALQQLARQADLFVISWTRATHAATDFIKAQRPPGRPPVYAAGSGSSSIAREISDQLRVIAQRT